MFIIKLNEDTWRSRCSFGTTSYEERAAQFETEKGAKISLAILRRHSGKGAYPNAVISEVKPLSEVRRKHWYA